MELNDIQAVDLLKSSLTGGSYLMHDHQPGGNERDKAKMASTKKRSIHRPDTAASMVVIGVTVHTVAMRPSKHQQDSKLEEYHLPLLGFEDHQSVV